MPPENTPMPSLFKLNHLYHNWEVSMNPLTVVFNFHTLFGLSFLIFLRRMSLQYGNLAKLTELKVNFAKFVMLYQFLFLCGFACSACYMGVYCIIRILYRIKLGFSVFFCIFSKADLLTSLFCELFFCV